MNFIKTYEGLFSKKEIPKELIDGIKSNIETEYKVSITRIKNEGDTVYDKVVFSTTTPIGIIDITISMRNKYTNHKSLFPKSVLGFKIQHGSTEFMSTQVDTEDWRTLISTSLSSIKYTMEQVDRNKNSDLEYKKFYDKITNDDIKDLLSDISDTIGEYKLERKKINSKRGFEIIFMVNINNVVLDSPYIETDDKFNSPTDEYVQIISDINTMSKRSSDLYNLNLRYKIDRDTLRILLYEK